MDLDLNMITIYSLIVVIAMLVIYIAYRFREEKVSLIGLDVDDLIGRVNESERLLQTIKGEQCWNCSSKEKEVIGNLYEENQVTLVCKQCGTKVVWQRGKKEWKMKTGTKNYLAKLEEKITDKKSGMQ